MAEVFRCGVVALVGRANVGKSTLFNRLVGTRLSIISKRPQTTREHILGIKTIPSTQWVYVDTPGIGSAVESQRYRYTQPARRQIRHRRGAGHQAARRHVARTRRLPRGASRRLSW